MTSATSAHSSMGGLEHRPNRPCFRVILADRPKHMGHPSMMIMMPWDPKVNKQKQKPSDSDVIRLRCVRNPTKSSFLTII